LGRESFGGAFSESLSEQILKKKISALPLYIQCCHEVNHDTLYDVLKMKNGCGAKKA